jgi:hypothetical protein
MAHVPLPLFVTRPGVKDGRVEKTSLQPESLSATGPVPMALVLGHCAYVARVMD